jgi:hypothetical protein
MISETTNKMIKMKKMTLAISTAATTMPVNPRIPAIRAITKKVSTQLNMSFLLFYL